MDEKVKEWRKKRRRIIKKKKKKKSSISRAEESESLELFKKRRKISKQQLKKARESESLVSNYHILTYDLLLEILNRIPDSRSIIRCSLVCQRWFSLINSPDYQKLKHSSSSSSPYTIIFRVDEWGRLHNPVYEYFSENSKLVHGISTSKTTPYLSFLPWRNVRILSSFRDLLLFSPSGMRRLMICNPLTKQLLWLPELPKSLRYCGAWGGLIVHEPNYRIMTICTTAIDIDEFTEFSAATFCSETGNWSVSSFSFLRRNLNTNPPVSCNGMLYWLEEDIETADVYRVVAFDPFKNPNHPEFIDFPSGFASQGMEKNCTPVTVRLGAVRGRLRLSQLLLIGETSVLKVWEFSSRWTLVHDVEVRSIFKRTTRRTILFVVAFHPENGDVLFLSRGFRGRIYRYDIGEEKMELVGKVTMDGNKILPIKLRAYTLTHPIWPTVLPSSV